jgi:hypothetical protein
MGSLDNEMQKIVDKDESRLPLFIHFEHIPTNFVHFSLVLCTGSVPLQLKPLLAVYLMNFFNTPLNRDGKRIEFEQVVAELEQDTITYSIDTGSAVGNSELIRIKFVIEPEKFETAVKWLRELLLNSIFDEEVSTTLFSSPGCKGHIRISDAKPTGTGGLYAFMACFPPRMPFRAVGVRGTGMLKQSGLFRPTSGPCGIVC